MKLKKKKMSDSTVAVGLILPRRHGKPLSAATTDVPCLVAAPTPLPTALTLALLRFLVPSFP
ncbi:hypothetical protein, partial [Escherichia coli]|uniref:hypothetical protein n=1 Tax=Escherichia coli TaxID=562 RepID=UPI001CA4BA39